MELGSENIIFPGRAGEAQWAVVGQSGADAFVVWDDIITVDKIDIGRLGQALEKGTVVLPGNGVPSHVGNFQIRCLRMIGEVKANASAGPDGKAPVLAVFAADLEEQLQTETYAQERFAGLDKRKDRLDQAERVQSLHGVGKGAHSR